MTTVISIENLWKEYRLGVISHGTLIHDLQSWWARVHGKEDPNAKIAPLLKGQEKQIEGDRFWALRDINIEVKEGEVLGIIGKNGAGKSTLLKILSRVTAPTRGSIKIKGRIASLLEVGTGFHPELTGRENVFMNGAINGMTKQEIRGKLDEIIDFSGVEDFIDTPVKRYSSGMRVRLGFAIAAHLDPEILIIDEVLAVGDAEFQKKCLGKMGEVARAGRTVLFVSHNMASIRKLCGKGLVVKEGAVSFAGNVAQSIEHYFGYSSHSLMQCAVRKWELDDAPGSNGFKLVYMQLVDRSGKSKEIFLNTESVFIEVEYVLLDSIYNMRMNLKILTSDEQVLFVSSSHDCEDLIKYPGKYKAVIELPANLFNDNVYKVFLQVGSPGVGEHLQGNVFLMFNVEKIIDSSGSSYEFKKPGFVAPAINWNIKKS